MGERSCIYSCKNHLQLFNPTEKIVMPASAVNEMVVMTMAKNKHLVNEERSQIEHLLRNGKSIKEIARTLDKSTSTISREIKKERCRVINQRVPGPQPVRPQEEL